MAMASANKPAFRILVINPNTTQSMTDALKPLVAGLDYGNTTYTYFTAPTGPSSINGEADCEASTRASLPHLLPMLETHDAFLVACFSPHPLVEALRSALPASSHKPVLGILEASVTASLNSIAESQRFGVVSTGRVWEQLVGRRVAEMLGSQGVEGDEDSGAGQPNGSAPYRSPVFGGVETTGLTATELHDAPQELVRRRVIEATKRLVGGGGEGQVGAVILGCAGMAAMEEWVREAVGERRVVVVDGVRAGVAALQAALRCGF